MSRFDDDTIVVVSSLNDNMLEPICINKIITFIAGFMFVLCDIETFPWPCFYFQSERNLLCHALTNTCTYTSASS